jgi:hypothetical protein
VKAIFRNSLLPDQKTSKREMFADLFGKWAEAERKAFEKRTADLERVDESAGPNEH